MTTDKQAVVEIHKNKPSYFVIVTCYHCGNSISLTEKRGEIGTFGNTHTNIFLGRCLMANCFEVVEGRFVSSNYGNNNVQDGQIMFDKDITWTFKPLDPEEEKMIGLRAVSSYDLNSRTPIKRKGGVSVYELPVGDGHRHNSGSVFSE